MNEYLEVLVHWKQFVPLNELNNCPCILKFQPIAVDLSLIHKHLSTKYTAHLSHAYVICKYHIFTYMYICVRIPFLEQRCALLSRCATQFLPTFDCLYKTLCFCCLLSLSLPYFYAISISLASHGSYLRLLWACPGSASVTATVCLLSTTVAWCWQRGVWATSYVRQDKTPGALVCIRLFWDLPHCPLYLKFVCDLFVYLFKLLNLH